MTLHEASDALGELAEVSGLDFSAAESSSLTTFNVVFLLGGLRFLLLPGLLVCFDVGFNTTTVYIVYSLVSSAIFMSY